LGQIPAEVQTNQIKKKEEITDQEERIHSLPAITTA
jgi:hypothetical protein